jgi:hypothetical protein
MFSVSINFSMMQHLRAVYCDMMPNIFSAGSLPLLSSVQGSCVVDSRPWPLFAVVPSTKGVLNRQVLSLCGNPWIVELIRQSVQRNKVGTKAARGEPSGNGVQG